MHTCTLELVSFAWAAAKETTCKYVDIWRKQFSGVTSRGVKWETKTYNLKGYYYWAGKSPRSSSLYTATIHYKANRFLSSWQVVTVALFPLVPMCRNVREGESVLIMTYVNVVLSGLEMTVRSTLVHLSTTARVRTMIHLDYIRRLSRIWWMFLAILIPLTSVQLILS